MLFRLGWFLFIAHEESLVIQILIMFAFLCKYAFCSNSLLPGCICLTGLYSKLILPTLSVHLVYFSLEMMDLSTGWGQDQIMPGIYLWGQMTVMTHFQIIFPSFFAFNCFKSKALFESLMEEKKMTRVMKVLLSHLFTTWQEWIGRCSIISAEVSEFWVKIWIYIWGRHSLVLC